MHIAVHGVQNVRDEDIITDLEGGLILHLERQHAPVHHVGAVTLGGILGADIRKAAQDALAACRLLARRAVTGLHAVNDTADFDCLFIDVGQDVFHFPECVFQSFIALCFARKSRFFECTDILCTLYVTGVAAGECELRKPQWVGAVRRRFAGRDQFVGRCDFIHNLRADAQQNVLRKCLLLRPILDVRAVDELIFRLCLAEAVVNAGAVGGIIVVVFRHFVVVRVLFGGGQNAAVCRRCRDRTCVHECDGAQLACARLGAFAVREVACSVADAQRVICRCVACAEARAAECGLHDGARRHEVGNGALCEQVHKHRL